MVMAWIKLLIFPGLLFLLLFASANPIIDRGLGNVIEFCRKIELPRLSRLFFWFCVFLFTTSLSGLTLWKRFREIWDSNLAVCTYQGGTREDYVEALQFLKQESNANTTNPEILKAFGTIYKHLWMEEKDEKLAELALNYYQKSYVLYPSHNSGLNYGLMLFALASYQIEKVMRDTYVFWARHVYRQTEQLCLHLNPIEDYWIAASLEECAVALEDHEKIERYRKTSEMAMALLDNSMEWKRKKTEEQISLLQELLSQIREVECQSSRPSGGGDVS